MKAYKTSIEGERLPEGPVDVFAVHHADGAVTRLAKWPEGLVLWHNGEIAWRQWRGTASDPRAEVRNVYRYLLSLRGKATVEGDRQRSIHLSQALDTIRAEWPDVIAEDEEE